MTVTALPPYTGGRDTHHGVVGNTTCCAKCRSSDADTTYKVADRCCGPSHDYETPRAMQDEPVANPRLCRRCRNCGYAWDEACLDGPEPAELDAGGAGGKRTIGSVVDGIEAPAEAFAHPAETDLARLTAEAARVRVELDEAIENPPAAVPPSPEDEAELAARGKVSETLAIAMKAPLDPDGLLTGRPPVPPPSAGAAAAVISRPKQPIVAQMNVLTIEKPPAIPRLIEEHLIGRTKASRRTRAWG